MSESAIGHSALGTVNNMQAPLLPTGGKKDFGKTFNVENPTLDKKKDFMADKGGHTFEEDNRGGGTHLSIDHKDESSGQQPKSSNISEDQSI